MHDTLDTFDFFIAIYCNVLDMLKIMQRCAVKNLTSWFHGAVSY